MPTTVAYVGMEDLAALYEVDAQPLPGSHRVYGGKRRKDGYPVIVKCLEREYPTNEEVACLRHEFSLLGRLSDAPVVQPIGLHRRGNGVSLVLEKAQGRALDRILLDGRPAPLRFCRLALYATRALELVHEQGIVHRDIKPHHFFVEEAEERAWLIDFGLATAFSRGHQAPVQPDRLEGTLAYISPEQTGRMNHSVDRRSDLYSLGVTLYELATGELPFPGEDALEMVHAHIARTPVAPRELRPDLPAALSGIVMHLLEKPPDERYQTARGLRLDLERVCDALAGSGEVAPFELGQDDCDGVLRVPEKIYGRDEQARALIASFREVCGGERRLVLVSGPAGVGKSALVHELHKELVRGGQFVSGKFDQYNRAVPYSALAKACGELVRAYLASSTSTLEAWKGRLRSSLGDNASVVSEVVPELVLALGELPPAVPLGPAEAHARFERSFRQFMQASAVEGAPLALFLDDLQWADSASLAMLELLLSSAEQRHLLVIANYRDVEVDAVHPLTKCLDRLERRVAILRLELGPLSDADVEQLVSDALPLRAEPIAPLARCIAQKTSGNPFFVTQFLQRLDAEGLLRFEAGRGYAWDIEAIRQLGATDNVVDLVLTRIGRLEEATQRLLELAACIGHEFELSTLAVIAESSRIAVARALRSAVAGGFLVPVGACHRVLDDLLQSDSSGPVDVRYRFAHDRVQQAATARIAESERSRVHAKIGRLLLGEAGPDGPTDEHLFDVVWQLNRGRDHLGNAEERLRLSGLNLRAAGRAKSAAAYASALELSTLCLELLGRDPWETAHAASHRAHLIAAECHHLAGNDAAALTLIDSVESNARSLLERVPARALKTTLITNQGRLDDATRISLETLALFGLQLPDPSDPAALGRAIGEAFGTYQRALGGREVTSLRELPEMRDAEKVALSSTIAGAIPAAFQSNPNLMALLVLRGVLILLEHGTAPLSPFFYALYGVVHNEITRDYARGYEFGEFGVELSRHPEYAASRGGVRVLMGLFLSHWVRPMGESAEHLERGSIEGLDVGDRLHANYGTGVAPAARLYAGESLVELAPQISAHLEIIRASGDVINTGFLRVVERTIACLRGNTVSLGCFDSEEFSEAEFERQAPPPVLGMYGTHKLMARFLAGDAEEALRVSSEFPPLPGLLYVPDYTFYRAMACAELAREAVPERRRELSEKLDEGIQKFALWAGSCPENFAARHELLLAERQALVSERAAALDHFERAVELAAQKRALHHLAIALERAGRFHHRQGHLRLARTALREARYQYERWGAIAKVRRLLEEFPDAGHVARAEPTRGLITSTTLSHRDAGTSSTEAGDLDLASAMRATEAMASELRLEPLLRRLIEIVVENAGATRGALVLPQDNGLRVRASLTLKPEKVETGLDEPLHDNPRLAASIVHYCARTREPVVLDDAAGNRRFGSDPYVSRNQSRSIVCLPLLHHGELAGVLYLENDGVTGAFHERRVDRLKFLGGHAAASLENARLYDKLKAANESLERRVAERTAELSARNGDMRRVLDNVAQGLLTIDLAGLLTTERSAVIDEWFGRFEGGTEFHECMAAIDARFAVLFRMAYEQLIEGFLPEDMALGQLPMSFDHAGRHFGASYEVIRNDGALTGLLIVIDDRTEALQRGKEEAEQKEELALCRQLTRHREGLIRFFDEGAHFVELIGTPQDSVAGLMAPLHTLKGNAAMLGFNLLAQHCHELENAIQAEQPTAALVAQLDARWSALQSFLKLLAGDDARERVEVSRQTLRDLVARIDHGSNPRDIAEELERLQLQPLSEPLTLLGDYARRLSDRLGKGELEILVSEGECRADAELSAPLWAALVHLVRNAIDHGFDRPEHHQRNGRPRSARLELKASRLGSDLCIELQDNGKGIDWERVRARAIERGLPAGDQRELTRALFGGRISTRDQVSETSGRGVGLNAVLLQVEELGGRIEVDSKPGAGCRFVVRVPCRALGVRGPRSASLDSSHGPALL